MTPDEERKVKESLNLIRRQITDLFRIGLQSGAWAEVFLEEIAELSSKQSERTKEHIKEELIRRKQAAYQRLLEEIEKKYPARAAELDNRGPDEISL